MLGWLRRLFCKRDPKSAWTLKDEVAEALMVRTGLRDEGVLLDNAMTLFSWAADIIEAGRVVASFDETGRKIRVATMSWMEYPMRLARVRNLLEDGLEDDLAGASALDEDMLDYLTVMW